MKFTVFALALYVAYELFDRGLPEIAGALIAVALVELWQQTNSVYIFKTRKRYRDDVREYLLKKKR